jgi:hypothetical protein
MEYYASSAIIKTTIKDGGNTNGIKVMYYLKLNGDSPFLKQILDIFRVNSEKWTRAWLAVILRST